MNRKQIYKTKQTVGTVAGNILKAIFCIIFAFPFYWMIITSFKTYNESIQYPPTLWPKVFTVEGFQAVFEGLDLMMYVKNTIIIVICVIIMQMIVMVPAAYAFARYKFKGNDLLFGLVTVAFMIPSQVTFITVYIMFSKMGVMKTLIPQILPFGANAFGIFLLRQNFKQISDELLESARLDDASELKIITSIMMPMAKPTLATIILLSFISHWEAYFWPLVMTTTEQVKPLTLAIDKLKDLEVGIIWPTIMAGNVLLLLPILILFLFASKRIISAMAYNGVK